MSVSPFLLRSPVNNSYLGDAAMPALHLMTFNVQCLPLGVNLYNGLSHDADARAHRICDGILALKAKDRPDVIALNEVFSEDARAAFKLRLGAAYTHVVEEVDLDTIGKIDDAGLMLFSRHAFLPLATGGTVHTAFYDKSEGSDSLAPKGVAMVRIDTPISPTTIGFTHMQASYDAEDQHRDIRESQFQQITDAFGALMTDDGHWGGAVLVGDLNVRGDSGRQTDEWSDTFDQSGSGPIRRMLDGWRTYMHPPPELGPETDKGLTNVTPATGVLQRLDYACFLRPQLADRVLVPHHMFIRFRTQSDHFALESIIQLQSPHCTPSRAIEALKADLIQGGTDDAPSEVRFFHLDFQHDGSYQWLYIKEPGTYSWWSGDADGKRLQVRAFEEDDLSRALETVEVDASDLSDDLQFINQDRKADPHGRTVVARKPLFLSVRMPSGKPGKGFLGLMTHRGESKTTALLLTPHVITSPAFPEGKRLGLDDACWLRAIMPPTYSGAERNEKFVADNPTGNILTLTLETDGLGIGQKRSGSDAELEIVHPTIGLTADDTAETVFIVMTRRDINDIGFGITWVSPVTYLMLDQPIGLFINDETGPDWPGDDEVRFQIEVDADPLPLFSGDWDEADTDENWPDLHQQIRLRAQSRVPGDRMGFCNALMLSWWEEDFTAKGSQSYVLDSLKPGDPETADRRITLKVPDAVSDGRYTFSCKLTKIP